MNAQNARSGGYEDGKRFFSGVYATLEDKPTSDDLLSSARNRAVYSYGVKALKTIDLYVAGWQEAIEWHEAQQAKEREEAARRAAIQHNPNTQFCTCQACSQGE